MNIDHNYYDTTYFIKKKKKGKKRIYNVLMYCMLLHVMSNFLAISRQWNKKKSKHQLYILLYTYQQAYKETEIWNKKK